jgi:hypothetical protein
VETVNLVVPQDPAETPQSEGRCPRDLAYYASLWSVGHVRLREVKKGKDKVFSFYYLEAPNYPRGVFLPIPRGLGQAFLNQRIGAIYAPRTDEQGVLKGRLDYLRRLDPALWERAPHFHLRARLIAVDPKEGHLQVEVRPNPGGRLKEPFTLTLLAPLSLLEALPPVGSAVYLEGELRPKSGRLVVRRWEPARLWDDPQ